MSNYKTADVLIVGAGPVGIFTAFQAGLLGMSSIIVDALAEVGGQLNALYPNKPIYDVPAFPSILAKDLIDQLVEQAKQFAPQYLLNQKVDTLTKEDNIFVVTTTGNQTIHVKSIMIAGGAGAFGPNRLPIKELDSYENKSVFYNVKDPNLFKDKTVVIAGGGDSAVDWAIELGESIASKIYLVHRRENFRALPSSLDKLKQMVETKKVDLIIPYMPKGVEGDGEKIYKVLLENVDGSKHFVEADYLIPFFGLTRDLGGLVNWGLELDKVNSTIVVANNTYETNIPGIYAIGDIAKYDHKLKLIMTGFSEAAYAVHHAWKYVFPDKPFRFIHSTSRN
ncbi:NAD(P)/FAD-dependent oxidoreductase [Rickettsiales bacterium LUAb2]